MVEESVGRAEDEREEVMLSIDEINKLKKENNRLKNYIFKLNKKNNKLKIKVNELNNKVKYLERTYVDDLEPLGCHGLND